MTDPPGGRETEIEAVAKCLFHWDYPNMDDRDIGTGYAERARLILAALDAVRSSGSAAPPKSHHVINDINWESGSAARNQEDEVNRLANDLAGDWRERAERAEADVTMWKTRLVDETARLRELLVAARSPQSEDQE